MSTTWMHITESMRAISIRATVLRGWSTRHLVTAVAIAIFVSPCLRAQSWNWTEQTVDSQPGRFTSLVADKDSNLHMLYSSDTEGFKYAFRPAGDSRWFTMRLEGGNGFTDIVVDSDGNPHACLAVNSASIIKYGSFKNSQWTFQQIAPGTGPVWFSCSVALASDGTPYVTWYQERGADLVLYGHYKLAILRDAVWTVQTIDFDPLTGKWHKIIIDQMGNPHISYDCFVNGELKYAVETGSHWNVSVVDSRHLSSSLQLHSAEQESLGMGNSVMLDDKGLAHFSYQTDTALKYAEQNGDSFKSQIVDSVKPWGSWVGYKTSLVLDQKGFPHIAYEDSGALKHAYWNGQRWNVQILAFNGPEPYRFSAMTIDHEGVIYISYRDPGDGSIKIKVGKPIESTPVTENTKQTTPTSAIEVGKTVGIPPRPQR